MRFDDLLRQSRSKPVSALHKFLSAYSTSQRRVFAFVEGDADKAFFRAYITDYLDKGEELRIIDCDGKDNVFATYTSVTQRYPACREVLFFVDKDLDDLTNRVLPQDPRIYTTRWYSIENEVVCSAAVERFFADFVKLRRVDVDMALIGPEFDIRLIECHRHLASVMAWILCCKRRNSRVVLNGVQVDQLLTVHSGRVHKARNRAAYLHRVTQCHQAPTWREVRQTAKQLRSLHPKQYIRGKFEAWFLVEFIKKTLEDLTRVATEQGGNVSVSTQLHITNVVQVLVRAVPMPAPLKTFLDFHLGQRKIVVDGRSEAQAANASRSWFSRIFRT